ncbi:cation diffusion facilitator family transporter [Streptomyces sp. 3MP-14]|uniref:Cation diffusion facilitator family transporter n=1 Tax=Streptomyces mimosae TaxID=2586635 RepID=A0A5N5ZUW9_9ACTN|nr:cation diffusion facilitator family transporter [Streptomyces mimosae]KAB8172944.1 cation diffusion facilitator family transporter [Streptomyces sp. 3MP-14]
MPKDSSTPGNENAPPAPRAHRHHRGPGDHRDHRDHDDHGAHHPDHRPGHRHGRSLRHRLVHLVRPHAHDASEAIRTAEEASREGIRAAWIGLAGMGITALLQIVIVALSGSMALLADTLHNLGHLVTTIPLVIAFRLGRRAPTATHPFGYRRAEDLAGLLIAAVIALSAALIIRESIDALLNPRPLTHLGWVLAAGVVGAAGNELVAVHRIRVGRRIGSAALVAEGHHARADGLTSLAVVLGAVGVWLGFDQADAVVGLVIAVAVLAVLVSSARTVVRRLMDGVEPGLVEGIHRAAAAVPGVEYVADVRARWSGHRLEAHVTIGVHADLTVADGHDLAQRTHHRLLHAIPHLESVGVHVHPSRDGATPADAHRLTAHHADPGARRGP